MIAKLGRLLVLCWAASFLMFSCAGKPAAESEQFPQIEEGLSPELSAEAPGSPPGPSVEQSSPLESAGLVFISEPPPALLPAPGVGTISRERQGSLLDDDERAILQGSFRGAYLDGLLRGLPLAGVLGGDQVHGWPDANPSGWVQNWRSSRPASNSWGIPSLVLAVQGVEIPRELAQDRVFIVSGEILNYYGISAGFGGANGDMGYGSPRGEEFFYNNGIAQRFDLGLIVIDRAGKGSFLPGDPPSTGLSAPPEVGVFTNAPQDGADQVRDAFLTAWEMALDRTIEAMVPDGPGQYLSFNGVFLDPPGGGELTGLYIQTFNGLKALLILPVSSALPLHVRFLSSPFLAPLLYSEGSALPELKYGGGDSFARRLMEGIARYGFPLTDPLPQKVDSLWQETQRFSGGWLRAANQELNEKS